MLNIHIKIKSDHEQIKIKKKLKGISIYIYIYICFQAFPKNATFLLLQKLWKNEKSKIDKYLSIFPGSPQSTIS